MRRQASFISPATLLAGPAYFPTDLEPDPVADSADSARRRPWPKETTFTSGSPTVALSTTRSGTVGLRPGLAGVGDDVRRLPARVARSPSSTFELLGERVEPPAQLRRLGARRRPARGATRRGCAAAAQQHDERAARRRRAADEDGRSHGVRPYLPRISRRIRSQRSLSAALGAEAGRLVVARRPATTSGAYCCSAMPQGVVVGVAVALPVAELLRAAVVGVAQVPAAPAPILPARTSALAASIAMMTALDLGASGQRDRRPGRG